LELLESKYVHAAYRRRTRTTRDYNMKKFRCFSKDVPGPIFPRFGLDPALRALSAVDHESAAEKFALRMARKQYGAGGRARAIKHDGAAGVGQIFVAWLEDASASHGNEVRFAVSE
jgi:hypothetical protein